MKMKRSALIAVTAMLLLSTASFAQRRGGWQYLGEAHVDGGRDHDNISVPGGARFRSIQLRVDNGPIEFDHVIVHYANGANDELSVRQVIPAGGSTRAIDLRGKRRDIRSVELFYGRAHRREGRPSVKLFGRM